MAYSNSIPAANDLLSQSQADLQQNFAAIQTLIEVNHATFADADEGKHKFVSFPEQGADVTVAANEKAIYAKQSALSGVAELFIRNESDGTVTEFTSSGQTANGWTRLPSGIMIKWGTSTVGANASANVNFDATIPFTTVYNILVTRQGSAGSSGTLYWQSNDTTNVVVYNASNDAGKTWYYLAIGI